MVARGTLAGQRTVTGTLAEIAAWRRRGAASGDHRGGPWPSCTTRWRGWSGGRCTARSWRSPARGHRRASWPAGCGRWGGGRGDAGDPDRAVGGRAAGATRPALLHEPERRAALLRGARRGRALAGRDADRGDRAGHGDRAARARHRGGRGAGALRGRGAARGARQRAARRPARARRPRGGGPRHAPGRPARTRRAGGGARALPDRGGAAERSADRRSSAPRT